MVLTVNWETSIDRRNTQLNCSVTADARSGYVYRLDVDFDPCATPLETFNATYLDDVGMPQNLTHDYAGSKVKAAPKFSWQRPTGRFHERQFFLLPASTRSRPFRAVPSDVCRRKVRISLLRGRM